MWVYIFQSEKDANVHGFTERLDGCNLPAEFAPWKLTGHVAIELGFALVGAEGTSTALRDGIRRDGYYLARPRP